MKFTRMVSRTLRFDSPEAETASHQLMLRAGLIHQVAAGVYSYLPLALRSLRKIENIIREEMDNAGGQELMLPALQPMELWEQTGRRAAFGDNLFSLQDRRGRPMVMAPHPRGSHKPTWSRATSRATATCHCCCTRSRPSSATNRAPAPASSGYASFDMKGRLQLQRRRRQPRRQLPGHGPGLPQHLPPLRPAGADGRGRQRGHRRQGTPTSSCSPLTPARTPSSPAPTATTLPTPKRPMRSTLPSNVNPRRRCRESPPPASRPSPG